MAETITCRLINGSSFPLSEQMSNQFCQRQTDTCVLCTPCCEGVCVCMVWPSDIGQLNDEKLFHSFEYATHFNDDASRPAIISVTQPTIERHEYTYNLLICLICPKIRWAWLSIRMHAIAIYAECGSVYWMYLTPQSIRWFWHRLLRRKLASNVRCVHVSCVVCLAGWLPN